MDEATGHHQPVRGRPSGSRRSDLRLEYVPVSRIRPEEGLSRKRDRAGHQELCTSIAQFGVLTPITVRPAPGDSGEFLLIKGQGRTLACRLLGIDQVPAIIVDKEFAETGKVQQFLVENVARMRMRPIDRALLIAYARRQGEETSEVARRFGVTPSTVRRLEAQLDGATASEVTALRQGDLNLASHAVIARMVAAEDRPDVIGALAGCRIGAKEMASLLAALGWPSLVALGAEHRDGRLRLLGWACETLALMPKASPRERIIELASRLPMRLPSNVVAARVEN